MAKSAQSSRIDLWARRLNRLPRPARILLSLVVTLELVILVWLALSQMFGINLFSTDSSLTVLLVVVLALGLVFYGIAWWAMVGFDSDPEHPWRAGTPAVILSILGVGGLVMVLVLGVLGLVLKYVVYQ